MLQNVMINATAQAWLTDSALIIPTTSKLVVQSCLRWYHLRCHLHCLVTRVQVTDLVYKYLELQDKAVTVDEYQKLKING